MSINAIAEPLAPACFTLARFWMRGLVQGQGVRPTIARLAVKHGIVGSVCNSSRGVEIQAVGEPIEMELFERELRSQFPNAAFAKECIEAFPQSEMSSFEIIETEIGDGLHTIIPRDLAICEDCAGEVRSATDWRGDYPFITCAVCGPRYSILRSMPFDRDSTAMDAFPMCPRCRAEYNDPDDRRFHAQTVCCPNCGPRCWVTDGSNNELADPIDAMNSIADRIAGGDIAAMKGIGGYQLICDATNDKTVQRLRRRKHRPSKPLPVMVGDVAVARRLASVSVTEQQALQSAEGPIVLLRAKDRAILSKWISPHLNTIGLMLPTSALHVILVDRVGRPLVVTSGNLHGSPIIFQNEIAQRELATVADVFLHHDREITNPVDDSVVQCIDEVPMTIRAGRGIAPIAFDSSSTNIRLATGGHQKVAVAIQTTDSIVLGAHIGDMESESSRVRFNFGVTDLQSLHQVKTPNFVHDRHPGYFTSDWALQNAIASQSAQHHHAHVVSAMLEHDLLEQIVLGIAFDGTGFGDDGTIWGGEALLATRSDFQRVGHLRPFRLPGGETAIKQPWRIAKSLRSQLGEMVDDSFRYAMDRGPITSSMGRLFDGVAAMVLGIESTNDEGEAAMRLESACEWNETASYEFSINEFTLPLGGSSEARGGSCVNPAPALLGSHRTDPPRERVNQTSRSRRYEAGSVDACLLNWHPVLLGIQNDLGELSAGRIAMKFHRAVADLVCSLASRYKTYPCVLSGGVFQNRVLLELIQKTAKHRSLDIRMPGWIPVNDGGLAIGQLLIAKGNSSCA